MVAVRDKGYDLIKTSIPLSDQVHDNVCLDADRCIDKVDAKLKAAVEKEVGRIRGLVGLAFSTAQKVRDSNFFSWFSGTQCEDDIDEIQDGDADEEDFGDEDDEEDSVAILNGYVMEDNRFSHGKPALAFTLHKCLLHWKCIVKINGASCVNRKNTVVALASYENGGKNSTINAPEKLEPLWDDGYGTQTMKDYTKIAMDLSRLTSSDGGPPRWFCLVALNRPLKDYPILMYLHGLEGSGTDLVVHEKALGSGISSNTNCQRVLMIRIACHKCASSIDDAQKRVISRYDRAFLDAHCASSEHFTTRNERRKRPFF
ncbi:unnamed protein product [Lactuca saligna]|uniref:Uncharacterized protein n=1 Tax=Lactuca saligna TaxID=75948 RepID=A0AA36DYE9_LACSI|nr:unnamed protein product [Lactuca saligna]